MLALRAVSHACILALVALVLVGELIGAWSGRVAGPDARRPHGAEPLPAAAVLGVPIVLAPLRIGRPDHMAIAPQLQRPIDLPSAFQAYHALTSGETLGAIAGRYRVSVETLALANDLDRGDALMVGQVLRIPYLSGIPHIVAEGETLELIAARFMVGPEAIMAFGPNHIGADMQMTPGTEIFVPGGIRPLSAEWLGFVGGLEGLARRGPEAVGLVREAMTNLRAGPSIEYPRVARLDAGRRAALRGRHEDWILVEVGAARGWVRQDMLDLAAEQVSALPETTDFPPPPPRWVWPTRGSISSYYGPRWGGFHNGIDIANRPWTPIVAARAGLVVEAGWCRGYGYCVRISHDGGVQTVYGHLIERPLVVVHERVAAGERIGSMGSTYDRAGGGYATGPHLHFTVSVNGRAVNPLRFLP